MLTFQDVLEKLLKSSRIGEKIENFNQLKQNNFTVLKLVTFKITNKIIAKKKCCTKLVNQLR